MGAGRTEASVSVTALHEQGHTQSQCPGPSLVSVWGAEQSRERQRVPVLAVGALSSTSLTLEMRQSSFFPRLGQSPAALLGVTQP